MSTPSRTPEYGSQPGEPSGLYTHPLIAGSLVLIGTAAYVATQVAFLPHGLVVIVASVVGVYMAMNIGANDVANNIGAAVGSGALTMAGALAVAVVFESAGALIAGGDVVDTISKGIIDPDAVAGPASFVRVMLAALIAAAVWINLATYVRAPVSTTHSIVGGVLGGGLAAAGMASVDWVVMGKIAASWVISPVLGAAVAAAILAMIKVSIIYRDNRVAAARQWVPVLVGVLGATFAAYLMLKGLKKVWQPDSATIALLSLATFAVVYGGVRPMVAAASRGMSNTREEVNRLFTVPLICGASLLAFAHGSNDVANAVGPLAAIVHIAAAGTVAAKVSIPPWVMLIGAMGLGAGLALFGAKMVRRVGTEITEIDQARAFAVVLSAAITVIIASALALPVSSTHIALGAIFGVGFLREYLENEAGKIRAIRELYEDSREPQLFDTARSEMRSLQSVIDELLRELPSGAEREHFSNLTVRARRAVQNWQNKKLVRRAHLRTIVAAWLITVPVTALIAGGTYWVIAQVPLPGLSD